jgi:catechol 2,3-dioxygenase-like lactoylglutathione lyase family enzyme
MEDAMARPVPVDQRTSPRTSPLTHLRHAAVAVPDFDRAVAFYQGVWGLTKVDSDSGIAFFAAAGSPENYILRVRRAAEKRLDLIAFGVADTGTVDLLADRFGRAGVLLDREPAAMQTPGGGYGFRCFDPDGRIVEISAGVASRPHRDLEERESIPKRLSHVVVNSPDVPRAKRFYEDLLGFRLSDWLEDRMCFLRCSPDHHSLAITAAPHASLNHVSFEMRGLDEYLRGTGRLMRAGHLPDWGPGRHSAGDNTFSYFLDPNRNVVEYTTELQQITDETAWVPQVWTTEPEEADQWGTARVSEELFPALRGTADRGVWESAPV